MKTTGSREAAIAAGAAVLTAAAGRASAEDEPKRDVPKPLADLLSKIPTKDRDEAHAVMARLAEGGPATVATLVELVGDEFGDPEGVGPKYALHGLVHFVSTPGADGDRGMVAETLARELSGDHSDELKAFLCRQLQLCGRSQEVPALGRLLTSDRLCEPAAQALLAINTDEATAALREALADAEEGRVTTIVKALGRQRDKASANAIRNLAGDPERDVRLVTWYALANIGDAGSKKLLLEVADDEPSYERDQATEACLLLARRLAASKQAGLMPRRSAAGCSPVAPGGRTRCMIAVRRWRAWWRPIGVRCHGRRPDRRAGIGNDPRYRHPAARTAVDLAALDPRRRSATEAARQLLEEGPGRQPKRRAVRQQAEILLET